MQNLRTRRVGRLAIKMKHFAKKGHIVPGFMWEILTIVGAIAILSPGTQVCISVYWKMTWLSIQATDCILSVII